MKTRYLPPVYTQIPQPITGTYCFPFCTAVCLLIGLNFYNIIYK